MKRKTLEELAEAFIEKAKASDPTIKTAYLGYDEIMRGPRETRVMSISFERAEQPENQTMYAV